MYFIRQNLYGLTFDPHLATFVQIMSSKVTIFFFLQLQNLSENPIKLYWSFLEYNVNVLIYLLIFTIVLSLFLANFKTKNKVESIVTFVLFPLLVVSFNVDRFLFPVSPTSGNFSSPNTTFFAGFLLSNMPSFLISCPYPANTKMKLILKT